MFTMHTLYLDGVLKEISLQYMRDGVPPSNFIQFRKKDFFMYWIFIVAPFYKLKILLHF